MIILTALLITLSVACVGWLMFSAGDMIVDSTIKRGIRKYIIPLLESKRYTYIDYKFDSLVQSVNFKDENSKPKFYMLQTDLRSTNMPIYIMVKYKADVDIKKVTVRIDTSAFFITNVTYSKEL